MAHPKSPTRTLGDELPRRVTVMDKMITRPTELMAGTRTRRNSMNDRRLPMERTESPERSTRRRFTRMKTKLLASANELRNHPRGRVSSIINYLGEDDDFSSRRPSSLPGLGVLESQGSAGLGFLQNKLRDLESAMQPELRKRAYTEELKRDLLDLEAFAKSKDLHHAVEEGYITEDFSRLIFDKFKNKPADEPQFLKQFELLDSGGLENVRDIPLEQKYFWFIVLLVSVVFNVSYLLHLDWSIFQTYFLEVFGTFNPVIIWDRLSNGGGVESKKHIQEELLNDPNFKVNIFGMISDHQTRMLIVNAAVVVAIWEVTWLGFQLVYSFYLLFVVCCDDSQYKRYNAIGYFFQKLLPQVSTFSAVKLLARVHPSLISQEYKMWLAESSEKMMCGHRRNFIGYVMLTITFTAFNVCCAAASISAFSIKMLAVSFKLVNPDISTWLRLASILATLNQVVGAVYLERVLQDRIFLFVFGGRDATYEDHELAYRNAYETRLMKEIWVQYWESGPELCDTNGATGCGTWPRYVWNAWTNVCNVVNALVLLATLDHYDLQYLMIDEQEEFDLFERLGLVDDAVQHSVSAPDTLSPDKHQKSSRSSRSQDKRQENAGCSLWATLGCQTVPRANSPELRAVREDEESGSPSRVNSPLAESEVPVFPEVDPAVAVAAVNAVAAEASVVPSEELYGPVCEEVPSEMARRDTDPDESSQPLLAAMTMTNLTKENEGSPSSCGSSRSGMEVLNRLFGKSASRTAWADGFSETSQASRPRRSRHLAWGDGSELNLSRSDSFDWEALFQADDMV